MTDYGDDLSEAVRRIVTATHAAANASARPLCAADLLRALLEDEGRATELLRQANVCVPDAAITEAPVSVPRLLRAARQLTRSGEATSSLHLLAALSQADAATANLLATQGLDLAQLLLQASGPDLARESIPVDLRIADAAPAVDDLSGTLRILDAAANRAREGLRVLEDHARFGLNDALLTTRLKELRHRLSQLTAGLLGDRALRLRDTPRDVGTRIHTSFETHRDSDLDIVRANAKRTQEALRTLEEFGKRLDTLAAAQLGELRYQSYTLEQALLVNAHARHRLDGVDLCLLATDTLCPRGVGPVVQAALATGCPMVQLREKQIPDAQLVARARLLREWTRNSGALLIINDRPDIAVLVDADGVHVGQDDLPVSAARRIVGGDRLVGVSTHHLGQVRQAVLDGADYLGVGPVFTSATKRFDELAGLDFVRAAAAETTLPWFAIGGITLDNLNELTAAGGRRIAVTNAICGAADPATATRSLRHRLEAARRGAIPAVDVAE